MHWSVIVISQYKAECMALFPETGSCRRWQCMTVFSETRSDRRWQFRGDIVYDDVLMPEIHAINITKLNIHDNAKTILLKNYSFWYINRLSKYVYWLSKTIRDRENLIVDLYPADKLRQKNNCDEKSQYTSDVRRIVKLLRNIIL